MLCRVPTAERGSFFGYTGIMLHSELTDEMLTESECDFISAVAAGMNDISLLALDIVRNSLEAGATEIGLDVNETDDSITVTVRDNGKGMEEPADALSLLYTSRTTRRVGMGLPIFRAKAEMTGGAFGITSNTGTEHGTVVTARFMKNGRASIPLGRLPETVVSIVSGLGCSELRFSHTVKDKIVTLDTHDIRDILDGTPLSVPAVLKWIGEYLAEQYK